MKKAVIICVDDEKMVLDSLKTELKGSFGANYIIETAENADEAIEIIQELLHNKCDIPLVISDYVMPNLKGDELLTKVHGLSPKTLKILLTGQATMEGVTNSINHANLYRYIAKPWEQNDLELTVNEAIKSFYQEKQLEEQNAQLRELNSALEAKVQERTAEIQRKSKELEEQKNELFQSNVNITASINYAKRIQQALLPSKDVFESLFTDSFIYFRPKDIVSGDFYWATQITDQEGNQDTLIAVADCTGHGVPGAFMSMLGMSFLNEIVQGYRISGKPIYPASILDQLKESVKNALKQTGKDNENKDGMDISLCIINQDKTKLQYAGAFNPLIIIRGNGTVEPEMIEVKADRMPIGIYYNEKNNFTNHEINLIKGDIIYMFTDGFIDQFGNDEGEKFKIKNFRLLLKETSKQPLKKQRDLFKDKFISWKGSFEQIDDVTVVGFKI